MRPSRLIPAGLPLLVLAGCGRNQSMMAPGGPGSEHIAGMAWWNFILYLAITAIMWVLILWLALRRRGTFERHEPVDAGGGQNWILIGGFTIPFLVLCAVFVVGLVNMSAFPLGGRMGQPADIQITGHQWWWQIEYVKGPVDRRITTANEIHVPVGVPVNIDLRSADVIHSFFVPSLNGKVDLIPGQINRVRIQADHAGPFRGQCAEFCGAQHARMILYVIADPPEKFAAWYNNQLRDASPPADEQQMRGQQVFFQGPCAACHAIRGTPAGGRVGPDLTHFASRVGIASNAYWNNRATLSAWVTHAQALKPEVAMPNITQFTGQQLQDLVSYLQNLK
jgi:cytochrome c oxidase subunit II